MIRNFANAEPPCFSDTSAYWMSRNFVIARHLSYSTWSELKETGNHSFVNERLVTPEVYVGRIGAHRCRMLVVVVVKVQVRLRLIWPASPGAHNGGVLDGPGFMPFMVGFINYSTDESHKGAFRLYGYRRVRRHIDDECSARSGDGRLVFHRPISAVIQYVGQQITDSTGLGLEVIRTLLPLTHLLQSVGRESEQACCDAVRERGIIIRKLGDVGDNALGRC
jgi:hypothetical protein